MYFCWCQNLLPLQRAPLDLGSALAANQIRVVDPTIASALSNKHGEPSGRERLTWVAAASENPGFSRNAINGPMPGFAILR
jgi:hypothetical protein